MSQAKEGGRTEPGRNLPPVLSTSNYVIKISVREIRYLIANTIDSTVYDPSWALHSLLFVLAAPR